MGKAKKSKSKPRRERRVRAEEPDDTYHVDAEDTSYFNDEVDKFHERSEKILLDKGAAWKKKQESSDEEEVLPLEFSGDDSDDDGDDENQMSGRKAFLKEDMESDLEGNDEDGLPDVKAWGKNKSAYYSTDYIDEDFGAGQGSDAEMAEEEEEEIALEQQKRIMTELDDDDIGLEFFTDLAKTETKVDDQPQKVEMDLSELSERQQQELLLKKSPEIPFLQKDLKEKMFEVLFELTPLRKLVDTGVITNVSGGDYIYYRQMLIYHYSMNVSFYLMLKAKNSPNVQNHPVIKRLVQLRKMLDIMEPTQQTLKPQMDFILKQINENASPKNIKFLLNISRVTEAEGISAEFKKRKRVRFHQPSSVVSTEVNAEEKPTTKRSRTAVENEETAEAENGNELSNEAPETGETDEYEKRRISYQIRKNKGLTPHRKREQRNPRVKYRNKYRKATINRKGQIREVRKELSRYGGELSGIKANISRSIKIK